MKKIIALVAFSVFAASSAFAASGATQTMVLTGATAVTGGTVYGDIAGATATTSSTLIGKTSTGVGFSAKTGVGGYAVSTQHKSGSRGIGGAFNSTTLVYKEATSPGTPAMLTPGASDFSAFDASWSSM